MTEDEIVVRWDSVYRVRDGVVVAEWRVPPDPAALADRLATRLDGGRTSEEEQALAALAGGAATSRDRRLGLAVVPRSAPEPPAPTSSDRALHRALLLAEAERRLQASWDPSVHVDEAVRSMAELDHTLNLFGERLVSWSGRDGPPGEEETGVSALAERLSGPAEAPLDPALPAPDPALVEARAELAGLYGRTAEARRRIEAAIATAMPRRAPNLSTLLGPVLAARMVAQAGGLDRLARLPAGTIQVLGAEKAFFEHLRGRAPPPRHGHLFLHPDVQSAPRQIRGRIARALAGKVAIAARLDAEGTPLRADVIEAFQRRARSVRQEGAARRRRGGPVRPRVTPST